VVIDHHDRIQGLDLNRGLNSYKSQDDVTWYFRVTFLLTTMVASKSTKTTKYSYAERMFYLIFALELLTTHVSRRSWGVHNSSEGASKTCGPYCDFASTRWVLIRNYWLHVRLIVVLMPLLSEDNGSGEARQAGSSMVELGGEGCP
jgi:hypothetical protein